ncbi:MAG: hypothetical protein K0R31_955, partial [Clostridiales bacterium]|nr:hypothetical protein [Clostridiales bacterium]
EFDMREYFNALEDFKKDYKVEIEIDIKH